MVSSGLSQSFRSSGRRGYSDSLRADPSRVFARKLEREIQVQFTPIACMVHAIPGERSTGTAGEHWRLVDYGDGSLGIVSRAIFSTTYAIILETVGH